MGNLEDVNLVTGEPSEPAGKSGGEDCVLSDREPVNFADIVYAEVLTSLTGQRLNDVIANRRGAAREFAQELFASLDMTHRSGQKVLGINMDNKRDVIVGKIEAAVKKAIEGSPVLLSRKAKECSVEGVPEGYTVATVTKTFNGMFLATPEFGGGKAFIVRFDPSGSFHAMRGDRFILRPTGAIDRSSGGASNPVATIVRKIKSKEEEQREKQNAEQVAKEEES